MAESQSNARLRADAGAPTSGVIHIRTRLTADFTVISNALAQRRGSAVTIGVATYILSLPDGSPISIAALCEHFEEGEILISRALRELERAGYLERRRERGPGGHIRTRTFFRSVPEGCDARPSKDSEPSGVAPAPVPDPASAPAPEAPPASPADADPRAVAVLASLRHVDSRLLLSGQDVARLAPAVAQWLAAGVLPTHITEHLTARLPDRLLARPAGILAFRLTETPVRVVNRALPPEPGSRAVTLPLQTCDGCERAFRAGTPGRCRDCRSGDRFRAAC
ncbi:hypothetical protein [Streptomyces sp. MMBL 11-3]|uniref:hypothetical protein n=1 Tax=Streptomyces sp. MMBL 11-3 TaxID=3382639 RepID=UPI0039B60DA4